VATEDGQTGILTNWKSQWLENAENLKVKSIISTLYN